MNNVTRWKFYLVQSLTLGRIPLILVLPTVTILAKHPLNSWWFSLAFGTMMISALTDLFDGYLARKFGVVTRLGAYADPLTDKVFYLVAFPTLVYLAALMNQLAHARFLLVLTIVFLMRDLWISFLRSIGALHQMDARANWSGKARTAIAFPVICAIYYFLQVPTHWPLQLPATLIYCLEVVCMVINLISILIYTRYYWPALRKETHLPNKHQQK
ncbi:MAG: CDP-alcohol phosphatidyltransferase family protein [Sedimentisphaerales bacterium]|nr:CDP-alcohol phosphatidyltransferase family protein [Sedimentisphaerales bacterium]